MAKKLFVLALVVGISCSTTVKVNNQERREAILLIQEARQAGVLLDEVRTNLNRDRQETIAWVRSVSMAMTQPQRLHESGYYPILRMLVEKDKIEKSIKQLQEVEFHTAAAQVYREQIVSEMKIIGGSVGDTTQLLNQVRMRLQSIQPGFIPSQTPEARSALEKLDVRTDGIMSVVRQMRQKYQITDSDLGVSQVASR